MQSYRKITPSSKQDSFKEDYEYLLMWISVSGGVRQWLFSSTDGMREDKFKSEVIDTISDYRSVPNTQDIKVSLTSGALSRDDFDYVASIFESNRIHRVAKDLTLTNISISSATKRTLKIIKDFNIAFDIMLQEPDLMDV